MPINDQPTVESGSWDVQNAYVERLMDNAAFTSAHPDDTLILAGPARQGKATSEDKKKMIAIGMMQNMSIQQSKPTQPYMSIGSGRSFFLSGKAQTQWSAGRLFVNGRNFLRALYTSAMQAGINPAGMPDLAAAASNPNLVLNLDSELFLIPFGLQIMFKDKVNNAIGSFYLELCMINSWQISFQAGTTFIAENVSGLSDRLVPVSFTSQSADTVAPKNADWNAGATPVMPEFSRNVTGPGTNV